MKKYLVSIFLCTITGVVMSKIMFNQYDTKKVSTTSLDKAYFFQVGVFTSLENMKKEASRYDSYIYVLEDNKYYVYIGITLENETKLKQYFDSSEYTTYVKEKEISEEFASVLKEYDQKLKSADTFEIEEINNNILKKYEELNNDKN